MSNNQLLAPPLTISTSVSDLTRSFKATTDTLLPIEQSSLHSRSSPATENLSPTSDVFLTVHTPTSETGGSLDGETLRSRSGSFNSSADTVRSRASSSANTFVAKSDFDDVPAEEALRPDKGNEDDFRIEDNPFAFTPGQLNKLLNPKSLAAFKALGGLRGLERGLRTDIRAGLSIDETRLDGKVTFEEVTNEKLGKASEERPVLSQDVQATNSNIEGQYGDRIRVYKDNRLPERKTDSIWTLLWKAYNDKILILLTIAAVVSLALGLYETFSGGSSVDWVEGVAICVAIIIVVLVTGLNDWRMGKQFVKLNKRKDDREVKAVRSGKSVQISVFDVTVGDVLHVEPGDAIPADGVFVSGHGVKCDESSATGESDQIKKTGGEEVWQQIVDGTATKKLDPFIISGSKVLEGVGTYLVTSVGEHSSFGKIMLSLQTESEHTPLQVKLAGLADWIGGLGSAAAGLLFFVLLFRFLAQLSDNTASAAVKGSQFLNILIVAITVIVVAVPEGLPLAVTLALAFATTRMLKENNLVRVLRACETMGNATTICSDKTGTLTENKMTVVAGTWGADEDFPQSSSAIAEDDRPTPTFSDVFDKISAAFSQLLGQSINLNSTAFEGEENGVKTFIGSKTETALLNMAKTYLGTDSLAAERSNADVVQVFPFDSGRKCMGAVIRLQSGAFRLVVKGAAELMLAPATSSLSDIYNDDLDDLELESLNDELRDRFSTKIDSYAKRSLRTIALLYKDFEQWPPQGARTLEDDKSMVDFDDVFSNMTWIGVVGIQDPLREGVVQAVARCQKSGVVVRMVTGDNVITAQAIATECGIMADEDSMVMEGTKFRQLPDEEMDKILPRLRVLARSSPEDKRVLVARLKHLGETVAVTGDGTNDGPALKTADVGFSMGIAGTEVAKEASSIILLDDNFKSIITAISWGRAVNDAVSKFLQFQITVNITAVLLTFVSAVSNSGNRSVLTAVQLLWVNLVMDTFAALALATDAPTDEILDRKPTPKRAPLFTPVMWKMIIGQAIYQLVVTFVLYFAADKILGYDFVAHPELQQELNTMVFNTFVWMQIFNEFNNRRLDNKFNIFEGVLKNYWFIGINFIMVAGQIMIVFIGGQAFGITRINGTQWAICIGCAIFCLPWAVVLRTIPDRYTEIVINFIVKVSGAVFGPVGKAFHWGFAPLARAWRAIVAPTKRFAARRIARLRRTKGETTETTNDVEASKPKGSETPISPPMNLPPITLTEAN